MKYLFALVFALCVSTFAYENLSPAQVHSRLVNGDRLQLLDVREISEYQAGHIAEPAGKPVLTPANMPLSSGVLQDNYDALPKDIDIIVYCRSGGRSASASAFLESKGFTRIFNMTSGFSGWSFESRTGGYGDGSGAWVDSGPMTIKCSQTPEAAWIEFQKSEHEQEAVYIELHKIDSAHAPFDSLPTPSNLYRINALNSFGLLIFNENFVDLNHLSFECFFVNSSADFKCSYYGSNGKWLDITDDTFYISEEIIIPGARLYKWILLESAVPSAVFVHDPVASFEVAQVYPNPFNSTLVIDAPADAIISIYDATGRFVTHVAQNRWMPAADIGSGVYFVRIQSKNKFIWKKVTFKK